MGNRPCAVAPEFAVVLSSLAAYAAVAPPCAAAAPRCVVVAA